MFCLTQSLRAQKQEATLFWEVARGPCYREDVKNSKHSPSLPGTCDSDYCTQLLLSFFRGSRPAHGRLFDLGKRRQPCLASALFLRASLYLPPLQAKRAANVRSADVGCASS